MYSQNNEEQVVMNYFNGIRGRLLDIGANDGMTYSNSRALLQNGWCGVLIDPSFQAFGLLQQVYQDRPDILCLSVGIAEKSGNRIFFESGSSGGRNDVGLVSTLYPEQKARWGNDVNFYDQQATFLSFSDFMTICDTGYNIRTFEFITIDAEGADSTILSQMDLQALGCRCLCIEHNSIPALLDHYIKAAGCFGLREIARNAENIIFAKQS